MKAVILNNKIITLEGFFRAEINNSGNGTKRDPDNYTIAIFYTNTTSVNTLSFGDDKAFAEQFLDYIYRVLTEKKG